MENTEVNEPRAKRQKTNHNKSAAFERLKQLKGKGSKNKYEVNELENVYEVVDEKEYSKNVWDRQGDDWIVDDDGSGYVEDGRDIFDDDLDSESIAAASKNAESRKRKKNVSKNAVRGNIQAMLSNMPEKKKEVVSLDQDDILSDLLSGMDNVSSVVSKRKQVEDSEEQSAKNYMKSFQAPKPVKVKIKSNTSKSEKPKEVEVLKDLPIEPNEIESEIVELSINENNKSENLIEENVPKPNSPIPIVDKDEVMDIDFNDSFQDVDIESPELDDDYDEFLKDTNWEAMLDGVKNESESNVSSIDNSDLPLIKNSDEDQIFKFFWWDAYEDTFKQPGVVFLFGKTYVESSQSYVSCCVVVRNIERKIFLLPRPFHLNPQTKEETDKPVRMCDVYNEFDEKISNKLNLCKFRSRKVTKKYTFDPEIPNQSEYLEVRYTGNPNLEMEGNTFSHIFGSNTSYLEIFLLERKIKGPCWLEIKNPKSVKNQLSWCKFEIDCNSPSDVIISSNEKKISPPPLVVATINIRTVPKTAGNEIVMIGCLVHNKYFVDKQPPNPPFQQHFCCFTKPTLQSLPVNFEEALKHYRGTEVQKCSSERALLNIFLNRFATIDPDLVVGHDLLEYHSVVLCDRIDKNKTAQWSRFGRLKRTLVPIRSKQKELMVGRLTCDLKISARELIKSRSYDLDTLCQTVLKLKEGERPNLEATDVLKMFENYEQLFKLISLTMQDAGYITKLLYELNVMPLALQITNIAGNVLSKTLQGGRAQRNEFLLLHAFTEKNYICPDKVKINYKEDTEDQNPSSSSRKKPTYSGGLVLDPKIGFYDKFILLMDFNSLYPSIIQEFNICFTTMQPNLETETMLKTASSEPGILPTEIRKLVESRREVKKLMANPDISNDLRMQYNIRQLALKLTANSMYGCLGFKNSRFFAKHLASLITMKGRDILLHTKDLVQSMGYEVIYGDTDSIMINTNNTDLDYVFKIGHNIKQFVNKSYKQIELDIDGVFKYMLLLKKKKYAAVTISKNKSGEIILQQEHKGLDIVRRDWSLIASEVGKMVLNHILSNQSADERIENIQGVLAKIASDLRENKIPVSLLVITKQLTKNPKAYTEKIPQSHVLVALRYNEKGGKPLIQGDTVPYVICIDGTNNSPTQRAYHVEELKRSESLKIDVEYYLACQIHPVVSRLCEPIEGLDAYHIANYLGIEASSFKKLKPKTAIESEHFLLNASAKKFTHAKPFEFICLSCKTTNIVNELVVEKGSNSHLWLEKCSNDQCRVKPITYLYSIENRFMLNIKKYIEQYYDKILICEDPSCINELSMLPLNFVGNYPACNLCNKGIMYRKYSEGDLYDQLNFYKHICDISKLEKKQLESEVENAYQKLKENIEYFLKKSGYSIIDLTYLYRRIGFGKTNPEAAIPEFIEYESDDPEDYI